MNKFLYLVSSYMITVAVTCNAMSPLHQAAFDGNAVLVAHLLKAPDVKINETNADGITPFHYAACNSHVEIVRLLLEHKADAKQKTNNGWTPLHYATFHNQVEMVKLLLDHEADVNEKTNNGRTPLHCAAYYGYREIIELLLNNKADVYEKTYDGRTAYDLAASNNFTDIATLLRNWPTIQQNTRNAKLAFCDVAHQRLGVNSFAKNLNIFLLQEILSYVPPFNTAQIQTPTSTTTQIISTGSAFVK